MSSQALRTAATGNGEGNVSKQLMNYFSQHKSQIEAALPKHLNADRMCRLALTAFHQNTALMKCDAKTVFASVVIASQLGLEIGVGGQGYLVPYKGKCTFVPGWQGLVDLVSRAGRAVVWTGSVFEGDDFDFAMGDSPFIKHRPKGEEDQAKLLYTYAVGRVKGSEWPVIEVWPMKKLKAHRDKFNKVGDRHYSYENFEMYARKVPLLQVIKYMPKSIELVNALAVDAANESGQNVVIDGDFVNVSGEDDPPARHEGGGAPDPAANQATGPKVEDRPKPEAVKPADKPAATEGATSLLTNVTRIIAAATASTDPEIADLKLDEARSMITELNKENQALARPLLDEATAAIQARRQQ